MRPNRIKAVFTYSRGICAEDVLFLLKNNYSVLRLIGLEDGGVEVEVEYDAGPLKNLVCFGWACEAA